VKFKRRIKSKPDVNITPLIDVVFLLLIFFMVSTTFTKETHLKVELPEADGIAKSDKPERIDLVISKDGSYSVNSRTLVNKQVKTIIAALKEVSENNKDLPITITADANSTHQAVVTAMDAAGKAGFVHLSITTQQPKQAP
jgi:biopolymer transport protein ExbD